MNTFSLSLHKWYPQNRILFIVYALFSILFLFVINDIIIIDPKYFTGGNEKSIKLFRNVYNVIYIINPIYSLIKIVFIAFLLKTALSFFFTLDTKFSQLFTLVTLSEFALLLPDLLEIIWFLLIHTDYTMEEVKYFHPFSLYSFIGNYDLSNAYDYPLRLINPFEISYWIMLIIGIKEITGKTTKDGLKEVASSYGLFLLVIILFRYFIYSSIYHE